MDSSESFRKLFIPCNELLARSLRWDLLVKEFSCSSKRFTRKTDFIKPDSTQEGPQTLDCARLLAVGEGVQLVMGGGKRAVAPVKAEDICVFDIEGNLGWFQTEVGQVTPLNNFLKNNVEVSQSLTTEVNIVSHLSNRAFNHQVTQELVC